jgi:hypothetical protein
MPRATFHRWQLVANGIKYSLTAVTTIRTCVPYWSWRQRRVE